MQPWVNDFLQQVTCWAQESPFLRGVLVIGSQARDFPPADAWSDLDLLLLVDDPAALAGRSDWIHRFGAVACWFDEVVPLEFDGWRWIEKRVLYASARDVDFSLLPAPRRDDVLAANRALLASGFRVAYDAAGGLEASARAAAQSCPLPAPPPLSEEGLRNLIGDLLFHVVWSLKKIRRGELWVAVSCINSYMKDRLLELVEASLRAGADPPANLPYGGRFLERRAGPDVLAALDGCFTRYDPSEAAQAALKLLDCVQSLAQITCRRSGYPFDPRPFDQARTVARILLQH